MSASTSTKPWTLLAYTVADDKAGLTPLDQAVKDEIKAICKAADLGEMHVAVQVDFKRTDGVFRAALTTKETRAFKDINPEKFDLWRHIVRMVEHSQLQPQKERRNTSAASPKVLSEFLKYGREQCPAERYIIFFYGHSWGPMGLFYDADSKRRTPSALRLNDLAAALQSDSGTAEVIMFRDCFMGSLEAAYELRGVARYMIGSQAGVPIAGQWPWLGLMSVLMGSADTAEVAKGLIQQMAGHFDIPANRGSVSDVPCSLIHLEATEALVEPFKMLVGELDAARADALRCAAYASAVEHARLGFRDNPHRRADPALLDVLTLCDTLASGPDGSVASLARTVGDLLNEKIVKRHFSQHRRFRGLSLYCVPVKPEQIERSVIRVEDVKKDHRYYEQLAFSRATGWHRLALHPLGA